MILVYFVSAIFIILANLMHRNFRQDYIGPLAIGHENLMIHIIYLKASLEEHFQVISILTI